MGRLIKSSDLVEGMVVRDKVGAQEFRVSGLSRVRRTFMLRPEGGNVGEVWSFEAFDGYEWTAVGQDDGPTIDGSLADRLRGLRDGGTFAVTDLNRRALLSEAIQFIERAEQHVTDDELDLLTLDDIMESFRRRKMNVVLVGESDQDQAGAIARFVRCTDDYRDEDGNLRQRNWRSAFGLLQLGLVMEAGSLAEANLRSPRDYTCEGN